MRRILLCMFLFVVASNLWAQEDAKSPSRDSAKVWYSVGKDYMKKELYESAVRNFKRALSYDSTFIQAWLDLALAFLEMKQFDSAEVAYRMVAKINPKDSRGWQGLGFMYGILKGDIEKGVEFYKKALEVDPENNDARFGLAKLLDKAGRGDEAREVYEEALKKDPDNPGILKSYGLFLSDEGDYEKSVSLLEKALPHFENDKEVRMALAEGYRKLGEKEPKYLPKALENLNYLIGIDSTDVTLFVKRASVYEEMKRYRDALKDYDRALELNPNYIVPYLKKAGLLIDKFRKYSEARALLLKALSLQCPENLKCAEIDLIADTYFQEAEKLRKEGDRLRKEGFERDAREKYAEAVKKYDKAIEEYRKATKYEGGQWVEYAKKQIVRAKKLRQKTWRKSQGIE